MRGQYSIDFFLVLSIVIAFSILLYNVAVGETGKARLLNSAVVGKVFLDEFSAGVDESALGGNVSRSRRELFVPQGTHCVFFNATENAFYCFLSSSFLEGDKNRLVGRRLLSNPNVNLACSFKPGWYLADFSNNGTAVTITCQPL